MGKDDKDKKNPWGAKRPGNDDRGPWGVGKSGGRSGYRHCHHRCTRPVDSQRILCC